MSNYQISNGKISICVKSAGAELYSLKKEDTEYMWEADPKYWARTSPVLFPFVGSLKNKEYIYDGKTYPMSQHGFARDKKFTLISQEETSIWFALDYSEETLAVYPFKFRLEIGYILEDNSVVVAWKVKNMDDKMMYFSIGAHPAFFCPLQGGGEQSDCFVRFLKEDGKAAKTISCNIINAQGLASGEFEKHELQEGRIQASETLFGKDALVLEDHQVQAVALVNAQREEYVRVEFDAPLVGVWTPPHKNAPFICIEPWYGRCDGADFEGELKDRKWGNQIVPGAGFEKQYRIII